MEFSNVYEDRERVEAYAKLEFPGTYYLAYRDIPELLRKHVKGTKAVDFGCGAGRSTRFLRKCGFEAVGLDISADMIQKAKEIDPDGEYLLITDEGPIPLEKHGYDLVAAVFTFDNIPYVERRIALLRKLGDLLNDGGKIMLLNSTPEIYVNEWVSFSTKDYPENRKARGGDRVKIIITAVEDKRPVEDVVWFHDDYMKLFDDAGLTLMESHKPLGREDEPFDWVNEREIAPWIIYVVEGIE